MHKKWKGDLVFFHPDYTVGFGITPNLPVPFGSETGSWADWRLLIELQLTTGGELHPALKRSLDYSVILHKKSCGGLD